MSGPVEFTRHVRERFSSGRITRVLGKESGPLQAPAGAGCHRTCAICSDSLVEESVFDDLGGNLTEVHVHTP